MRYQNKTRVLELLGKMQDLENRIKKIEDKRYQYVAIVFRASCNTDKIIEVPTLSDLDEFSPAANSFVEHIRVRWLAEFNELENELNQL